MRAVSGAWGLDARWRLVALVADRLRGLTEGRADELLSEKIEAVRRGGGAKRGAAGKTDNCAIGWGCCMPTCSRAGSMGKALRN